MPYQDLRTYLGSLRENNKLLVIDKEVDKDWEIAAVSRVIFQDIPSEKRPAILFNHVKNFDIPVVAGIVGGSREIYAMALGTTVDGIYGLWKKAQDRPIPPRVVQQGPCQENVLQGVKSDIFKFPVPIWTVEHDPGPYLTAPCVITRDPITGIQNMGTYRVQLKESRKLGLWINPGMHGRNHINMNNAKGQPTPVAIVLGADPTVCLSSVTRVPYGVDEMAIAGGLRGEAVDVVRCQTSDLLVPASSEIVIEGLIRPNEYEKEGPFGEYSGYMGPSTQGFVIDITCINHRNNPIYHSFISQMPPSESSCIRAVGRENSLLWHLQNYLRLPVRDVHILEAGGASAYMVISLEKQFEGQQMQAAWGAWSLDPFIGKITVLTDADVDIRDVNILNWVLSYRIRPKEDITILPYTPAVRLDPSQAPESVPQGDIKRQISSRVLIDATMKWDFPPVSMPPKDHLQRVRSSLHEYLQGFNF